MPEPNDREETAFTCSICGASLDDQLAVRTHELEAHGGEGPGTHVPDEATDEPTPSVTGGSAPPP